MSARAWLSTLIVCLAFWGVFIGSLWAVGAFAHVKGCHSTACDRRVHKKRAARWCRTHSVCVWKHRWLAIPPYGRRWTSCVSRLESNNRRIARDSGFLSYFQWTSSTWHNAGGYGNPEYAATWYEQAVRAWFWHLSHPHGQWPNTGENGRCGS